MFFYIFLAIILWRTFENLIFPWLRTKINFVDRITSYIMSNVMESVAEKNEYPLNDNKTEIVEEISTESISKRNSSPKSSSFHQIIKKKNNNELSAIIFNRKDFDGLNQFDKIRYVGIYTMDTVLCTMLPLLTAIVGNNGSFKKKKSS